MAVRGTTFDDTQFLKGLKLADQATRRGVRRGFAKCLAHGEAQAKKYCPIDQRPKHAGGTLQATIQGDAKSIEITDEKATGHLTAGGGEASDYAVRQHEETLTHSHPYSGRYPSKFIEKALQDVSLSAGAVVADEVRKEIG